MLINLNRSNNNHLKRQLKKKYYFHALICLKSRIKFRASEHVFMIKVNNNVSIVKRKETSLNVRILDNKIFLFSKDLSKVNDFIMTVSKFSSLTCFI